MDAEQMQAMLAGGFEKKVPEKIHDPIPDDTRALVMQAIFVSFGPTKKGFKLQVRLTRSS